MKQAGQFVVFEGIEGVGKSTQLNRLSQCLKDEGVEYICTREPGGTPMAEKIRNVFLDEGQEPISAWTELLLVFAARVQHIQNVIAPALAQGKWVLCDRFTDASYAYQGAGRGLGVDKVKALRDLILGDFKPDKVVLLHMPVAQALSRLTSRDKQDRMDKESLAFYAKVQNAYFNLADSDKDRYIQIEAGANADKVWEQLKQALGFL